MAVCQYSCATDAHIGKFGSGGCKEQTEDLAEGVTDVIACICDSDECNKKACKKDAFEGGAQRNMAFNAALLSLLVIALNM